MSNLLAEFEHHEAEIFRRGEVRGEARGEVRGKALSILTIFAGRGLPVSDAARARILSCTELATLDGWLLRALTAASVDSLFAAN